MTGRGEPYAFDGEDVVEPFRAGPGFFAFVLLACLPAIIAVAVFFGAWAVAGEVEAAERNSVAGDHESTVEPWKKTLVGLCPVH